jgi:ATP-dependent DNA ligase
VLCAFDLIELDGKDLRSAPLEQRKRVLTDVLHRELDSIVLNVHLRL